MALGDATINHLTSVLEAFDVFFGRLRPKRALARAGRLGIEAVSDSVLLVQIALEIHVRQGRGEMRLLEGNQPKVHALGAELLLKLEIGGLRVSLDVSLDSFLNAVNFLLGDGLDDHVKCSANANIGIVLALKFTGGLARGCHVV